MELSPEEQAHWRGRLRDEERRLSRRFQANEDQLANEREANQDPDDAGNWASRSETNDFLRNLEEGERREFHAIQDAWRRLDEGSYGTCEVCGEAIPQARLEAIPYAARCVRHAS